MGFSGKSQIDGGGFECESRKWVIAGIPLLGPLKPLYKKPVESEGDNGDDEECSTTPTGEETRIPTRKTCPPPPRKRKASLKCNYNSGVSVREFFTPPDLETVFIRHVERAN
ncbi:hypothetical protein CFOL_v3_22382 [Cephalotus follicularis]|uniref:Cyclin-dependent protein kinase inhibitor SMR6 n=1 Tax=Cephalotus follicularis TaxID=3775 RepID=A0A1Q3CFC5_CEPFO|nr:hypothetical protein CFOL_v3_22382 [Cephalotus follicularis]